jgi:hypothetical protein
MKDAVPLLLDFIGRLQETPAEVMSWARPHLDNLGNSLLGVIPPNGFPTDHKRVVAQYQAVFQQRLVLRDAELGFVKGAGFARTDQVESTEEWLSAAEALQLLKPRLGEYEARKTICKRAHSGLIRARAAPYMVRDRVLQDDKVPKEFWWAEGDAALTQNWQTGDFETYDPRGEVRYRAFAVSFLRADIEKVIPAGAQGPPAPVVKPYAAKAPVAARRRTGAKTS